jgi:hypothetical protein
MSDVHEHHLVLLGYLNEGYGDHPVRWCLECGLVLEEFGEGKFAEMVPSWSREKLESSETKRAIFKHVASVPMSAVKSPRPAENLTLRQLLKQEPSLPMPKLFGPDADQDK